MPLGKEIIGRIGAGCNKVGPIDNHLNLHPVAGAVGLPSPYCIVISMRGVGKRKYQGRTKGVSTGNPYVRLFTGGTLLYVLLIDIKKHIVVSNNIDIDNRSVRGRGIIVMVVKDPK